jgi:hypothetical protein
MSFFSRQFCGQHSYGHQDYLDHVEQLPEELSQNSYHVLNKPQESFVDKIDNNEPLIHPQ